MKRSLRNQCGKINWEQANDDMRKTMHVFEEIGAKDPTLHTEFKLITMAGLTTSCGLAAAVGFSTHFLEMS